MKDPILVVMAAGMGSRYGGMKQLDPVGENGQFIIDYSVYDAYRAGFKTVVFIIKKEMEQLFRETVGDRLSRTVCVRYAFQNLEDVPNGFSVPEGRVKPWGTAHAVLAARGAIDAPFAVINADDYYGPEAFRLIYSYLSAHADAVQPYEFAMVGYLLKNTVTDNGHVARGVCTADENGYLMNVTERTHIEKRPGGIAFTENDGADWTPLADNTIVSMNLWGFSESLLAETEERFASFLKKALAENPLKAEYFLPSVVSALIGEGKARVKVLQSHDKWYGMTYKADKPIVTQAIAAKTARGEYPACLWKA